MALHIKLGDEDLGEFNLDRLDVRTAIELEELTGLTAPEVLDGAKRYSGRALRAIVWLQRRRQGQNVAPEAITFEIGDFSVDVIEDPQTPAAPAPAPAASETPETAGSPLSATTSA